MSCLCSLFLEGHADAVEFCPQAGWVNVVAAASYTLVEQPTPVRLGGLYIFAVERSQPHLRQLHHRTTSGIFDLKWRPGDLQPCLGQASADGTVTTYALQQSDEGLEEMQRLEVSNSMCLSLDWNPHRRSAQVAVSQADGSLALLDFATASPVVESSWQAHGFEAWMCAFDFWKPELVFSGGDDCHFCGWDSRGSLVFRDRKSHSMGVCGIQSNPVKENTVVTGSYDEKLRVWDLRMMQRPVIVGGVGLGGGVWRIKWHPNMGNLLLAACMHNGFAIVEMDEAGTNFKVVEEYRKHESLAYGADWFRGKCEDFVEFCVNDPDDDKKTASYVSEEESKVSRPAAVKAIIATCSFYDNALHLWKPTASILL